MVTYAAPKAMKYGRTAIVCLAADLDAAATSRFVKRHLAGDGDETQLFLAGRAIDLSQFFSVLVGGKPNRLIIIAHGDAGSTGLFAGNQAGAKKYAPQELASLVFGWVSGYRIGTVSLDACYSGGNKGPAGDEAKFDTWTVRPRASFAFEFASHFGSADRVTGRTDHGTTHYLQDHGQGLYRAGDMPSYNTVGGGNRYHAAWDKIIITPNRQARPNHRVDASSTINTKYVTGGLPPQPI
jgi:hypothetical protein